jgi:cytidylate kinase
MFILNTKVITLIIGSPGSGKSTMAAKLIYMAGKAGIPAFCNYPVLGAYPVDMATMSLYDLSKVTDADKAVLIIDEAGLYYNSRSSTQKGSKSFTADLYHWYATTRHRNTQVFIIVQSWKRVDTILRELGTEVIMCRKGIFGFTTYRSYQSETTLIEDYNGNATEFTELFAKIGWRCFWRPNYYHMFDSYHLDRPYNVPDWDLYDPGHFPQKQRLWRRLLGLAPRATERGDGGPPEGAGEAEQEEIPV